MLALRPAQIRAEIEQIVLNVDQDVASYRVSDVKQGNPDDRVRFVDTAVGRHAYMELGQPGTVSKRRAPVVAGAGVNPIELHRDCPVRPSWTARSPHRNSAKASFTIQDRHNSACAPVRDRLSDRLRRR